MSIGRVHCHNFFPSQINKKLTFVQLGLKLNTKLALKHPPPTMNFSNGSMPSKRLRFVVKTQP